MARSEASQDLTPAVLSDLMVTTFHMLTALQTHFEEAELESRPQGLHFPRLVVHLLAPSLHS